MPWNEALRLDVLFVIRVSFAAVVKSTRYTRVKGHWAIDEFFLTFQEILGEEKEKSIFWFSF